MKVLAVASGALLLSAALAIASGEERGWRESSGNAAESSEGSNEPKEAESRALTESEEERDLGKSSDKAAERSEGSNEMMEAEGRGLDLTQKSGKSDKKPKRRNRWRNKGVSECFNRGAYKKDAAFISEMDVGKKADSSTCQDKCKDEIDGCYKTTYEVVGSGDQETKKCSYFKANAVFVKAKGQKGKKKKPRVWSGPSTCDHTICPATKVRLNKMYKRTGKVKHIFSRKMRVNFEDCRQMCIGEAICDAINYRSITDEDATDESCDLVKDIEKDESVELKNRRDWKTWDKYCRLPKDTAI